MVVAAAKAGVEMVAAAAAVEVGQWGMVEVVEVAAGVE